MTQDFAIIGLGRFGGSICQTLAEAGQQVLAIDSDENQVNAYRDIATQAVVADAQDEAVLRELGIQNMDHVIIAIGEDIQASILVTLMVKELGVANITAKAQNEYHARVLEKIGATHVVHPERDMGVRIANRLVSHNILDYLDLTDQYTIAEVQVRNTNIDGQTLIKLNLPAKYGLTIIAIRRKGSVIVSPAANTQVQAQDSLLVVGETNQVRRLDEQLSKKN